jgi:hypothetical protein
MTCSVFMVSDTIRFFRIRQRNSSVFSIRIAEDLAQTFSMPQIGSR